MSARYFSRFSPSRTYAAHCAGLALLHHQRNDAALKELARVYVRDVLERWASGAKLVALVVEQDSPQLTLRLRIRERETTAAVDTSQER